jgi:hypothetical protein
MEYLSSLFERRPPLIRGQTLPRPRINLLHPTNYPGPAPCSMR